MQKLIEEIVAKLESEGQNPKTHLKECYTVNQ